MILITGATGHLGGAVIRQLLTQLPAAQIAALARNPEKAEELKSLGVDVRTGHYDDRDSLDRAMKGIDQVLLISGGDAPNGLDQHKQVVDAAKEAGVTGIAYTSRSLKDRNTLANGLMVRHFQTEDYIRASGLPYTIFENGLYMETIPRFAGDTITDAGIRLPAGDGRVAFALRGEQGEAMANVLAREPFANKTYRFTGPEAWSFGDVAAALSVLLQRPVSYHPEEDHAFNARLSERGLPQDVVQRILGFLTDIRNGQESGVHADMALALGRTPASLLDGLRTMY